MFGDSMVVMFNFCITYYGYTWAVISAFAEHYYCTNGLLWVCHGVVSLVESLVVFV